jgi:hypothetical protein
MRKMQVAIATGVLAALPALGFAQSGAATSPRPANVTVHATKGVVQSVNADNLVITRSQHGSRNEVRAESVDEALR